MRAEAAGAAARRAYVGGFRAVRAALAGTGLLGWLEARRDSRTRLWLRSLFAIHDFDDLAGLDLPWWNLAAAEAVERFLAARTGAEVFEYGSGASSLWLARRAARVVSVEHDAAWAGPVAARAGAFPNLTLRLVEPARSDRVDAMRSVRAAPGLDFTAYVRAIEAAGGPFDLVVIDGRCRPQCLRAAAARLKADGLIVLDNSRRHRYQAAIARSGLAARPYYGLAACLPYPDETTLLARDPDILQGP